MIKFNDIEGEYRESASWMASNEEAAFNIDACPAKDKEWFNHQALARWLYGSSQEIIQNYEKTMLNFYKQIPIVPELNNMISIWHRDLGEKLRQFKDKLAMEAIKT